MKEVTHLFCTYGYDIAETMNCTSNEDKAWLDNFWDTPPVITHFTKENNIEKNV